MPSDNVIQMGRHFVLSCVKCDGTIFQLLGTYELECVHCQAIIGGLEITPVDMPEISGTSDETDE